jgi:hypothetical protein
MSMLLIFVCFFSQSVHTIAGDGCAGALRRRPSDRRRGRERSAGRSLKP